MDTLPVRSTKASETNANCSALSKDGEHELVQGHGASENTELAFSNPLYAEPEREVTCEIYESVSIFSASRHVVLDLGISYCTCKNVSTEFCSFLFRAILMLQAQNGDFVFLQR